MDLEDLVDYVEWDQSAQLVFWIPAAAQIWHFCWGRLTPHIRGANRPPCKWHSQVIGHGFPLDGACEGPAAQQNAHITMFTQGFPKMGVPQNHVFFWFPGKTDGFLCTHILGHLHIRIRTTVDSSCMFQTTKWWRIPINMFRSHQPAHSPRNITGTPGHFFFTSTKQRRCHSPWVMQIPMPFKKAVWNHGSCYDK